MTLAVHVRWIAKQKEEKKRGRKRKTAVAHRNSFQGNSKERKKKKNHNFKAHFSFPGKPINYVFFFFHENRKTSRKL